MADFMLSATMGLNGFIAMGVAQDWATHMIGHELTALHGLTHGATLAIVLPGTLRVLSAQKGDKLLQYGERVWGITTGERDERIRLAIERTEGFFRSLGLSTRLSEEGIGEETIAEIERRFDAPRPRRGLQRRRRHGAPHPRSVSLTTVGNRMKNRRPLAEVSGFVFRGR